MQFPISGSIDVVFFKIVVHSFVECSKKLKVVVFRKDRCCGIHCIFSINSPKGKYYNFFTTDNRHFLFTKSTIFVENSIYG